MTRLGLSGLAMLVGLTGFSAVGCCDVEKDKIATLEKRCNQLSRDLTEASAARTDAEQKLTAVTADRDALSLRVKELETKPPEIPTGKDPGGDWVSHALGSRLNIGADVLFDAGQATLKSGGKSALDKAAADLKGSYAGLPVLVYGYTDNDPIKKSKKLWQDNLDLSANRAMAVTRYLISQGIAAGQIETIAMGDSKAGGASKADKAKDRRVEIVVIKKGN